MSRKLVRDADAANLQAMQNAGAKLVRPDRGAFMRAMEAVYPRARAVYGAGVDAISTDAKAAKGAKAV